MQTRRVTRVGLGLIFIYFVGLGLAYAHSIPIFEASDEAEHLLYIHTILERGELPVIQSRAQMQQQSDPVQRWNNQAHHAPLYYLTSAVLVSWSTRGHIADYLIPNELIFLRNTVAQNPNKWLHRYDAPTSDTERVVFVLRLFNIAIGTGTIGMVFFTVKQLSYGDGLALLAALFTASLPTFIVVNSSITNDSLVIFLYTAGIAWSLRIWHTQAITWRDTALISLILSGSALTKLTGLSLFGVVFGILLFGIGRGRWQWRAAAKVITLSLLATALLAGWWYARNWQLYGDPFALAATASIWGRETPLTFAKLLLELGRIAQSFWMMVGYLHYPIFAPLRFYLYVAGICLIALVGLVRLFVSNKSGQRDELCLLLFVCGLVSAVLLWGTRSVDISYGRLLLPAIAAFAPLMLLGWRALLGRFHGLLLLPVMGLALAAPLVIIPQAYPSLELVDTVSQNATAIHWRQESFEIVAVDVHQTRVNPGDTLTLDLYLRGNHPDNPALLVTAADSLRAKRLGHVEVYPGMAATNQLEAAQLYRVPLRIPLEIIPDEVRQPRLITILIEWVDLESNTGLVFDNGDSLLEVSGPTFIDERYRAHNLPISLAAQFGEKIMLQSYAMPMAIDAGAHLPIMLNWHPQQQIDLAWTLTLQLFDEQGNFITQSDGMPYWYPTTAWVANVMFTDERTLVIPPDTPPGRYAVRLGWYRQNEEQFVRLPLTSGSGVDNLLVLPQRLHVR